jgi:hypothetical protein
MEKVREYYDYAVYKAGNEYIAVHKNDGVVGTSKDLYNAKMGCFEYEQNKNKETGETNHHSMKDCFVERDINKYVANLPGGRPTGGVGKDI